MRKSIVFFLVAMIICSMSGVCVSALDNPESIVPIVEVIAENYKKTLQPPPDSYTKALLQAYSDSLGGEVVLRIRIHPDAEMQDCKLTVTYNPEVLQYASRGIVTCVSKLFSEVTQESDGKLLISISRDNDTGNYYTDGFCFAVLKTGEPQLQFEILSYTDETGQREDAQLVTDIPFSQVEYVDRYGDNLTLKEKVWVRLAEIEISFEKTKTTFFNWIKECFIDLFGVD